jgi:hypothetical protein
MGKKDNRICGVELMRSQDRLAGRPSEGVIAEVRGERVRIYPTAELRDQTAAAFSFARKWNTVGLPADTFPLVAQGGGAFATPGETLVGHGGIAIEEVIVPLIRFERRGHDEQTS